MNVLSNQRSFRIVNRHVCCFQWAFGVVLWELITLAQQPYSEVDPFEMAAYLRDGYRLAQPHNCPDQLLVHLTSYSIVNN